MTRKELDEKLRKIYDKHFCGDDKDMLLEVFALGMTAAADAAASAARAAALAEARST